ncbi:MAG: hypothetical protein KF802_02525 [Bdellovibrionaceae bacterium]|nr:hypothetical protein [Pseudobdellovibrionaceae bacterium]
MSKDNSNPKNLEKVEVDLKRPNQPGDSLAPIKSWKDCYDLIYLGFYRLFYNSIPEDKRELTKEEVDDRLS